MRSFEINISPCDENYYAIIENKMADTYLERISQTESDWLCFHIAYILDKR